MERLLDKNLKSDNAKFIIKHNDDYDSELTDFEEETDLQNTSKSSKGSGKVSSLTKSLCNVSKQPSYISGDEDSDENQAETCSVAKFVKDKKDQKANVTHRAVRLPDLDLTLKESPGVLTRHFYEVVKSMKTSHSVINPTTLFSSLCKK